MRVPSDLPRRRPSRGPSRIGNRGRIVLIAVFVLVVLLFIFARSLAGFYVEALWYQSVGRSGVFWETLRTKALLAAVFTAGFIAVGLASLTIADRLAPVVRPAGPEEQLLERYREIVGQRHGTLRVAIAVLFGLVAGLPASSHWQEWLLFRNSVSFNKVDEQFKTDVGFYVFRLPFLNYLVNWLFAAFIVILLLTALAHYLNGGIRLQPGGRRVTPQVKLHLSALLAVLAVLKAADYWLQRFELTTSTRGYVEGATYTDVKAQLPALQLLILISLLAAALLFVNVRQRGWRLPVIAVGLWLVVAVIAGTIYPAIVQRFQVEPSESSREAAYIGRNIRATRAAMNLDQVEVKDFTPGTITPEQVQQDQQSVADVRLLTPSIIRETMRVDQGLRAGYIIGGPNGDLDVDRYTIDGKVQQVVLGARELDLANLPLNSWEGQHLAYTHGYGLAFAPASKVDAEGKPLYVTVDSPDNALKLTRPEVYVGDGIGGYAVVDTQRTGGEETLDPAKPKYSGNGGVQLNSKLRRAAFAIYYGEYNLLGSKLIDDNSRIIYKRDVRERVSKVAPFLRLDADPYPVVVDGKLEWVVDAYTTTSRYPNAESADVRQLPAGSGLRGSFNYVRNSVKAVVDAYDGSVTLYIVDDTDPIVAAWSKAFPGLFTAGSAVPADLRAHFRYPEDLFRVQTNLYGAYQLKDPGEFYSQLLAWSVAQAAPSEQNASTVATDAATSLADSTTAASTSGRTSDSNSNRFVPYYSLFRAPGATTSEFVLLRPFVPYSTNDEAKQLSGFMTVSSDPATYGKLTAYVVPLPRPDGPLTVAQKTSQRFSSELTLLDSQGTQVVFGDLQLVPLGDGFIYARPWFLVPTTGQQIATLASVSLTYNNSYVKGNSLGEALGKLFPGVNVDLGDRPSGTATDSTGTGTDTSGTDTGGTGTGGTDTGGTTVGTGNAEQLLQQAQQAYDDAQKALAEFDSKTYAAQMKKAYELARQAAEAATGKEITVATTVPGASSSTTAPPTTSPSGSSTTVPEAPTTTVASSNTGTATGPTTTGN